MREGILSTASTVTSAAFVMVGVFGVFATLSAIDFKQMGVGLAVAILIDATVVRAVARYASARTDDPWLPPQAHRIQPGVPRTPPELPL